MEMVRYTKQRHAQKVNRLTTGQYYVLQKLGL